MSEELRSWRKERQALIDQANTHATHYSGDRYSGRTTANILNAIGRAIQKPDNLIELRDHIDTQASRRVFTEKIKRIISKLKLDGFYINESTSMLIFTLNPEGISPYHSVFFRLVKPVRQEEDEAEPKEDTASPEAVVRKRFDDVVAAIDKKFGDKYSTKNPDLVKFMMVEISQEIHIRNNPPTY